MGSNPFAGMDWMQRIADSHGKHVVTGDEAQAGKVDIDTHVTGATCFLVQIYRAGVNVSGDAVVTLASGVLNVADVTVGEPTYNMTAGDVIMYWVW